MSNKDHKFWKNQPVLQYGSNETKIGEFENKTIDDIRKTPYDIPENFYWSTMDINNENDLNDIHKLLYNNYVSDSQFKFNYSKEFLKWALTPKDYFQDWHVGVKMKGKNKDKLVGFISGIPVNISINKNEFKKIIKMCEINFLCCWNKLRNKRLAPLMIKEVTRRVNCCNIFQAVYTAGIKIPNSFSDSNYYHRALNIQKLIETGFSDKKENVSLKILKKYYNLQSEPMSPNIRPLEEKDLESAHKLVKNYLQKFTIHPVWTLEEFKYWFFPKEDIIYTYVISDKNNNVTDLCSFFSVSNTILNNNKYDNLRIAYSYYNVSTKISLENLMTDCLILAKKNNFDVFNALDLMDNHSFFEKLKFKIGNGNLKYYLYNFNLNKITKRENGIVLF